MQESLEGQPLDRVLTVASRGAGLPQRLAPQIASDVLPALEHAHGLRAEDGSALELVHGAVRPHNIFIGPDGRVKLLDFGAAWLEPVAARPPDVQRALAPYLAPEEREAG